MILEATAIAVGLFSTLVKASVHWRRRILEHPWVFEVCVFILLLWIHGGSADGAMAATISTVILGGLHSVARKMYGY